MEFKVHYFDYAGRAEPIRWLLKYGGIEFEDVRYEEYEEWPRVKETMPFNQLPVLEIDGVKFVQSKAILRFLAKKVGLAGENELEALEIDSIVETIDDFMMKIVPTAWLTDDNPKKAPQMAQIKSEVLPFYLTKFEEIAKANKNFLACEKLTWADFILASYEEYLNWIFKDNLKVFEAYPSLSSIHDKVVNIPEIKKWIEERPKSKFLLRNERTKID